MIAMKANCYGHLLNLKEYGFLRRTPQKGDETNIKSVEYILYMLL